jgi:hypothetical protein
VMKLLAGGHKKSSTVSLKNINIFTWCSIRGTWGFDRTLYSETLREIGQRTWWEELLF